MPRGRVARPLVDRFWERVDVSGEHWLWTGGLDKSGHARMSVGSTQRLFVHRVSWEIHNGPIPAGMEVCHHCDIPNCVKPECLFLGTHLDNMRDRDAKGRGRHGVTRGEARPMAKLTDVAVREIRSSTDSQNVLAARYGVSRRAIRYVLAGETWRHVDELPTELA